MGYQSQFMEVNQFYKISDKHFRILINYRNN